MFLGCSNPSTSSPRTSVVFLPRRPDWASTMCFTLVPTRIHRYFTAIKSQLEWREQDQRYLYALTFPEKIILMKQSLTESNIIRKMLRKCNLPHNSCSTHTEPESSCKDFSLAATVAAGFSCTVYSKVAQFTAARGQQPPSDLPAESVEINGGQSCRGASSEQWNSRDVQIQSMSHLVCPLGCSGACMVLQRHLHVRQNLIRFGAKCEKIFWIWLILTKKHHTWPSSSSVSDKPIRKCFSFFKSMCNLRI